MTDWEDRLLENLLDEKVGNITPPDQVESILAAANASEPQSDWTETDAANESSPVVPSSRRLPGNQPGFNGRKAKRMSLDSDRRQIGVGQFSGRRSWLLIGVATAASLLLITTAAIFYQRIFESSDTQPIAEQQGVGPSVTNVTLVNRDGFLMLNTTDVGNVGGHTLLRDGWIFADEESPDMLVGVSLLEFHNARAVVRFGRKPNSYEAVGIAQQLKVSGIIKTEEEFNMLIHTRNWVASVGLAICMLSGQAAVNSQEVQLQSLSSDITLRDVFDRFDLNKDDSIQGDEHVCKHSAECDLDRDGSVTFEEFSKSVSHMAGSKAEFLALVGQHGSIDEFYEYVKSGGLEKMADVSMESVFAFLDQDGNGELKTEECICPGSRSSDANEDGIVTKAELRATAVKFFGSEDAFLSVVREKGGVEAFFKSVADEHDSASHQTSFEAVFQQYDKDQSGVLETSECICHGSKMADANGDKIVTKEELSKVALSMFGTMEKFEQYIAECGGAEKFYLEMSKH